MAAGRYAAYAMSEADRNTLRVHGVYLIESVTPSTKLLAYLEGTSPPVLNKASKAGILSKPTVHDQVSEMLDILPKKGPEAFSHFVDALLRDEQVNIARTLSPSAAKQWESRGNSSTKLPVQETQSTSYTVTSQETAATKKTKRKTSGPSQKTLMDICVQRVNPKHSRIRKIIDDKKGVYKMSANPRGRALIINNRNYPGRVRYGTEYDAHNLINLFKALHFKVRMEEDLTTQGLQGVVTQEAEDEELQHSDCFVMFIMSHGSQDYIECTDGKTLHIQDSIIAPFNGKNCKHLNGKPKIFFIGSCQIDLSMSTKFRQLSVGSIQSDSSKISHRDADIIVAYSTMPGEESFRDLERGSWFARSVVEVFNEYAHEDELHALLIKVRRKVDEYAGEHAGKEQLTKTDGTPNKLLYFLPGYFA